MQSNTKRHPQQRGLILLHPDGYLEVFAERGVEFHVARIPAAFSIEGECQAEEVMEALLPGRFRELYRADYLREVASTRPLLPSTLKQALGMKDLLRLLGDLPAKLQEAAA